MALTKKQKEKRNNQIAEAQAAIVAGNPTKAQQIVNNLVGGSNVGGAQAALQSAIRSMPSPSVAPAQTPPAPSFNVPITTKPAPAPSIPMSITSVRVAPPPPQPTPPSPWNTVMTFTRPLGIKQADPDIVIDPEIDTTGDYIVERFFEELGGTELISISRHDLIDGIDVSYKPIANLSRLRRRFNPNNIIALDILSDNEFSKFNINILSRGMNEPFFDDDGNLVVEIDIIKPEENIEVEISLSGTVTRMESEEVVVS